MFNSSSETISDADDFSASLVSWFQNRQIVVLPLLKELYDQYIGRPYKPKRSDGDVDSQAGIVSSVSNVFWAPLQSARVGVSHVSSLYDPHMEQALEEAIEAVSFIEEGGTPNHFTNVMQKTNFATEAYGDNTKGSTKRLLVLGEITELQETSRSNNWSQQLIPVVGKPSLNNTLVTKLLEQIETSKKYTNFSINLSECGEEFMHKLREKIVEIDPKYLTFALNKSEELAPVLPSKRATM